MHTDRSATDEARRDRQELAFLQALAKRLPGDIRLLRALADLYTRTGAHAEGLRLDRQLSRICPGDPLVWYNLACSLALCEHPDDAIEALGRAVELGYDDYEWMKKDDDLAALRGDARFESILEWIYDTFEQIADDSD